VFHFAKYHNEEAILLGHLAYDKECWLINLAALSDNDRHALSQIARSPDAQHTPYLASLLSTTGMLKSGTAETWWTWLMAQDDPVVVVPLRDLDDVDPDQYEFFQTMEERVVSRAPYNRQTAATVRQLTHALRPNK
jgi:hypothetical protein